MVSKCELFLKYPRKRGKVVSGLIQFATCATLASCSPKPGVRATQEEPSVIQSIPGEDSSIPVQFAQGFDHLVNEPKRQCVTLDAPSNQPDNENVGGATSVFQMKKIESSQDLHETLNISAAGSLQGMWGRGSATLKFADSVKMRSSSVYIMVHAKSANQLKISSNPKWAPDTEAELRRAASVSQEEYERTLKSLCGTRFINGYRTGGEFFAVYEYRFESEDRFTEFSAKVNASNGIWKASTSIDSLKNLLAQNELVNMFILRRGPTDDFPAPDGLVNAARGITGQTIDATAGLSNEAVTLELIDMGYETVLPVIKPNSEVGKKVQINLNILNSERLGLIDLKNRIDDVQKDRWNYEVSAAFDAAAADTLRAIDARINAVNDAAVVCIEDATACRLPTEPAKPSVNLPRFLRTVQLPNSSEYATKTVNWENQVQMDLDIPGKLSPSFKAEIFPEENEDGSGQLNFFDYRFTAFDSMGKIHRGGLYDPLSDALFETRVRVKVQGKKFSLDQVEKIEIGVPGFKGLEGRVSGNGRVTLSAISDTNDVRVFFADLPYGSTWTSQNRLTNRIKEQLNSIKINRSKIEDLANRIATRRMR